MRKKQTMNKSEFIAFLKIQLAYHEKASKTEYESKMKDIINGLENSDRKSKKTSGTPQK